MTATVGLRELRQQASEIIRRVEQGEQITVTVSGRPVARVVPAERDAWRPYADIVRLFAGSGDAGWREDRQRLDVEPRDPWDPR